MAHPAPPHPLSLLALLAPPQAAPATPPLVSDAEIKAAAEAMVGAPESRPAATCTAIPGALQP